MSSRGWHRIFYTKENDLDLGYFWVTPYIMSGVVAFWLASVGIVRVSTVMWSFLASVLTIMLIATIPRDRARILAESKAPSEIAAAIAKNPVEPDNRRDDERGDHKNREDV